jgi:hypothetical protein
MMKIKDMTIEQKMTVAKKLQKLDVPWSVTRSGISISTFGDQVTFGADGDYISLEEAQDVIRYLMKEFGVY